MGPVVENRLREEPHGHVGPSPRPVDGEKAQPRCRNRVQMAVGMGHQLVGLFGGRVQAQGMVDRVVDRKGQFFVRAIHRARGGVDEVLDARMAAAFEHVGKADEIAVDVRGRILQRIPHAGLRGQMHDRAEIAIAENRLDRPAIGKIDLVEVEILKLSQNREARFLECRIVIVIDAINANDAAPVLKKAPRQREAKKAGCTGDQNGVMWHRRPSKFSVIQAGKSMMLGSRVYCSRMAGKTAKTPDEGNP